MTRDDLERRWARDLAQAEATFLKDGELLPLFVVVGRGGRSTPIMANLADEDGREMTYAVVRCAAVANDAVLVLYRSEAWAVRGDIMAEGVSPGTSERRAEVVVVAAAAGPDGADRIEFRTSLREIERGADARPTGLRDCALPPGDEPDDPEPDGTADAYAGPLADLPPRDRPSPAERRSARDILERALKRAGRGKLSFHHV